MARKFTSKLICPECGNSKASGNIVCQACHERDPTLAARLWAKMDHSIPRTSAPSPVPPKKKSLLDGMTSEERKQYPLVTGCLDYFRDALLKVSHVSWLGNQKHNPGQPLHWARDKSPDEIDALGRHLAGRENIDVIDPAHSELTVEEGAEMVWRALAWYQKLLEAKYNLEPPPGCK